MSNYKFSQIGSDIDGEALFDYSGNTDTGEVGSLSISADGSIVAIGARGNDGNGNSSGHVRIYQNNNGTWEQIGIDIDGEANGDGSSVLSISDDGSIVAIGASGNDGNGDNSGHVRIYKNNNGTWEQIGSDISEEPRVDNY